MKYPVATEEDFKLFFEQEAQESQPDTKSVFNPLIGAKITKVLVTKLCENLIFQSSGGEYFNFQVYGDRCSDSWFSDIFGFSNLIESEILSTEEIPLDGYKLDDGRCLQEEDEVYGYRIKTRRGIAVIAFRNSSNGYYGGWCELSEKISDEVLQIFPDSNDIWQAD